jgi:hypothetical protein
MKKPETEFEWALHRCHLSCRIGRDALNKEGQTDFALYQVLSAIDDLAEALALTSAASFLSGPKSRTAIEPPTRSGR